MKCLSLIHSALPILTLLLLIVLPQQLFALPFLRKELIERNKRRADRVQAALEASTGSSWSEPAIAPNHSFAAWVTLNDDGTLSIGGQILRSSEPFHVIARDNLHISRAVATCQGDGAVIITSHGQVFLVRFTKPGWTVSPANISP